MPGKRSPAWAVLCLILIILPAASALAMNSGSHVDVTRTAFAVLGDMAPDLYDALAGCDLGTCPEIASMKGVNRVLSGLSFADAVAEEAKLTDYYDDLELVDVRGLMAGRDDPHFDEPGAVDDRAHFGEIGLNFTAFNHFIDIKKGPGVFDDYDGYAYYRGSASHDQYMDASEAVPGWAGILAALTGMKTDEGISWWFRDEYVHVKGEDWYRDCSPAAERYSFPGDKGIYASVDEELRARFPLARASGAEGCGIPYSVFMPVDNMARYWYGRFLATRDPLTLGPVLHAVQDAAVPHHAAGYCGNWHTAYENDLEERMPSWLGDEAFIEDVGETAAAWDRLDPAPPETLLPEDWSREPSIDWSIDRLVTWVAVNAYRQYETIYGGFEDGYRFDADAARDLTRIAAAVSVLVLEKAACSLP